MFDNHKELREFYKHYPHLYYEFITGTKLTKWQIKLLKLKSPFMFSKKHGRRLALEYMKVYKTLMNLE